MANRILSPTWELGVQAARRCTGRQVLVTTAASTCSWLSRGWSPLQQTPRVTRRCTSQQCMGARCKSFVCCSCSLQAHCAQRSDSMHDSPDRTVLSRLLCPGSLWWRTRLPQSSRACAWSPTHAAARPSTQLWHASKERFVPVPGDSPACSRLVRVVSTTCTRCWAELACVQGASPGMGWKDACHWNARQYKVQAVRR